MKYLILKNSTNILACSKEASKDLFIKEAEIINNGIEINRFINHDYTKEEYRKLKNLPKDAFIIGHVGGFRPEKNHVKLIDIFLSLNKKIKNLHLVMVGEGETKPTVKSLINKYEIEDNVHFLGARKDIEVILKTFDVFVFPSLYEGLGIAIIEAQVSGLYCVISNTIPRTVDITGNVCFLPLEADIEQWGNAILDHRCKSINKSKIKDFDIKIITERMYNIYSN
ncbi:hypothetical protein CAI16_14990 [Virgibacillus dokdonensis]|uniref:Glycosyl transferase family 1 domain-containing protein n=1 Tax=Virgibacillus dokdonensis TaxID=302167 RepID=A0A3E0WKA6_9BACI|nr:glycosyltransferase [Virgibacillus dokdonensis]RFA33380.1 hypothetical protein CAI16_14990 [Virgibacillus dokdonensis]